MNCSIRIPKRSSLTRKSSGINTCSATFNLSCWWGNMYVDGVAGSTRQSLEWCTRVSLSFIIRHEYLAPIPLTRYPVTRTAKYRAAANITWPTQPNITWSSLYRTPSCKSMQAQRPCRREKTEDRCDEPVKCKVMKYKYKEEKSYIFAICLILCCIKHLNDQIKSVINIGNNITIMIEYIYSSHDYN